MSGEIEQLQQLTKVTWDGNLISKDARSQLRKKGYVDSINGWNFLTKKGVKTLVELRLLKDEQ